MKLRCKSGALEILTSIEQRSYMYQCVKPNHQNRVECTATRIPVFLQITPKNSAKNKAVFYEVTMNDIT
jgi:hypothetical protein